MQLLSVPSEKLGEVWPMIAPDVQRVRRRSVEDWDEIDLAHAIMTGKAWLYVGFDPDYAGFVVLRPQPRHDGVNVHIWAAASRIGRRIEDVERIARDAGAVSMTFSSPRRGWVRRPMGFEPVQTTWRKAL